MASLERKKIKTDKAPSAIGPYSQAIVMGNMVFVSGQIALDPATGEFKDGSVEEQAVQALENVKAILDAAGCTLENVVKTTIFLKDMKDFGTVNGIYGKYFEAGLPARSCVEVAQIPKGALVEVELIAMKEA